jgi:hypothetical protein
MEKVTAKGAVRAAHFTAQPEFVDHKGAFFSFGFPRTSLYRLMAEGKIKSVSLRKPGGLRGKRLFDWASIREFLRSQMEANANAVK